MYEFITMNRSTALYHVLVKSNKKKELTRLHFFFIIIAMIAQQYYNLYKIMGQKQLYYILKPINYNIRYLHCKA